MADQGFDYSSCQFEARLQKVSLLRRKEDFYLYFSPDKVIINRQPYSKKPDIVFELMPTTHVKWLWENSKRDRKDSQKLKGFIIETEGHLNEFIAERVVLEMLKGRFKEITLQSDFSDEYVLGKYIDKGNYAQVYECHRRDNKSRHAVKILEKERLKTIKNGKESVFNELKILRHLHHKNLMELFEVFEDRNKYYFVLELLEGITLYKEIQNRKKKKGFKPHQIRAVIRQLLEGVKFMSEQNIMHRDIKPENILFGSREALETGEGSEGLKIVDYGLATFQHEPQVIFTKCGTPGFVAPEIISYDEKEPLYGVNVDVFSVGVILHILLVGEQAFPGRSRNTILNKNKESKLDFKSKKYECVASDGLDLLAKLLEKHPEKRIRPAEALAHSFLVRDRPIFKFRKALPDANDSQAPNFQVQMYNNLEEIAAESSHPTHTPRLPQNTAINQVASLYLKQLAYYNPFSHEASRSGSREGYINATSTQSQHNINIKGLISGRGPQQLSPTQSRGEQHSMDTKSLQRELNLGDCQKIDDFFCYDRSRPS